MRASSPGKGVSKRRSKNHSHPLGEDAKSTSLAGGRGSAAGGGSLIAGTQIFRGDRPTPVALASALSDQEAASSMMEGYQALTGKEKEALRLLLNGHDAKSMASHLGLSVHTVNERLRDARRKLSVSSSKAAARIVRDAETATPQSVGYKVLGDADAAPDGQTFDPRPVVSPPASRAAWAIGGFAMITLFVAALAFSSPEPAAPPALAAAATRLVADSDASRAARDWLTLVDAGNWPESWAATGAYFQTVNSLANWQAAAEQVHARLGPAVSRELVRDDSTPAPPNGYRSVRFRTTFANNRSATEVLALSREGDRWRVVGITVE